METEDAHVRTPTSDLLTFGLLYDLRTITCKSIKNDPCTKLCNSDTDIP